MLRIPSRRCQAKRATRQTMMVWFPTNAVLEVNAGVSPIKTSTKVPLTLAPHPPTLRGVGHWLPRGIGKSLSK